MQDRIAEPISAETFAPFGATISLSGRVDLVDQLVNLRPDARARLSVITFPSITLPTNIGALERHAFSSQVFLPLDGADYFVAVAPAGPSPDVNAIRAFTVPGDTGIVYHPGTWHHAMRSLGRAARFAVFVYNDGTAGDTEGADFSLISVAGLELAPGG